MVLVAVAVTIRRLLRKVRLIQDLVLNCPPSIMAFVYMPFVLPSILCSIPNEGKICDCEDEILKISGSEVSRRTFLSRLRTYPLIHTHTHTQVSNGVRLQLLKY